MASSGSSTPFMETCCPESLQLDIHDCYNRLIGYGYSGSSILQNVSRQEAVEYITSVVANLKPRCRIDERIYIELGKMVHIRIRVKTTTLDKWLNSMELALLPQVIRDISINMPGVKRVLEQFEIHDYEPLCELGLQSALKYEEMYLANLENGALESMGQFFLRLAATAATASTPEMRQALNAKLPTWFRVFKSFFFYLSRQLMIPATPIMLFGGRTKGSLASCYLLSPIMTDTETAINALIRDVAPILLRRGGIGICLQNFNKKLSKECTKGVLPLLKLLDSMTIAINSDSERPTGVCIYVEPWHADIRSILNMRGMLASDENSRCDNIFSCLWTPDLFFDRYQRHLGGEVNVIWTLFDDAASHLSKLYGKEFNEEYERLEAAGMGVDSLPIQEMAYLIVRSAIMTGSPFLMFKDACNRHYHFDTRGDALTTSNLCTEIIQKATDTKHGVCNLISINLPQCLRRIAHDQSLYFSIPLLIRAAYTATIFVNAMMRAGNFPTEAAMRGVEENRSLGLGIQGLHTTFLALEMDMVSYEARRLNRQILESLLLGAIHASTSLCKLGMTPFKNFRESIYGRGLLPFDAYPNTPLIHFKKWQQLRVVMMKYGLYNSQFVALMPTVSSSQVTESSEGFSPIFTNLFSKVTSTGEILRPNLQLMRTIRRLFPRECARLSVISTLEAAQWSIRGAFGDLGDYHPLAKFKTAFEYDQRQLIDMCADRAPFVDQSQSMSLFISEPADGKLPASRIMNLLVHAYKCGLKTGMYYCKLKKATNSGVFSGGELICTSCHL
ncbi:ribonucleotide reductase subunit 1 [Felid alphaherpesvirus 1]|uniref:Ribonucleoside-diphosphate reductase large subunit n=1 Tax=Feline herpesvirus 1 TaxID=10334 RepID=D1FXU3_FHV1|nr:ribonucleotide reductase subunit 1 [Felid alphaherpesvirus 1]AMN88951.1 ribonucleotide reductase subunit 1 [synthetic construct]ACT88319.1 ribonucleotide reductase subunit 1 [Felid alphaherpesvirus 1]ALJ84069.1 ribonucleotide reductase subunit 1 [Felid alphaherpesvirus 1]ALJ84145.1 ribonucleotide reductase subunit 1 [Felid alphaherpesvirus 1]ALJ84221.1 ribonucleotide reductase subunit 1 [Felid alphaherpesvirus 1]